MLVDFLLTASDEAEATEGLYDEALAYTVVDGRPFVTFSGFSRTITDTRIGSEAPDTENWTTTTSTKIRQEDDDRG